jgi:hypothetical protein
MQYPLLHRFQGAFLGAIAGEAIARGALQAAAQPLFECDRRMRFYAESLIDPARPEDPNHPMFQETLSPVTAAISLLPVLLFFHENPLQLKLNLQAVLDLWHPPAVDLKPLLSVGSVIAPILQEDLPNAAVAPSVQSLLEQSISLSEAAKAIGSTQPSELDPAIALALYCFLSTAGEFRLSILRAAQVGTPEVCALTGALSGLHNTLRGMPMEWRIALRDQQQAWHPLAAQLFAQWAGVYEVQRGSMISPTVAAPQILRRQP